MLTTVYNILSGLSFVNRLKSVKVKLFQINFALFFLKNHLHFVLLFYIILLAVKNSQGGVVMAKCEICERGMLTGRHISITRSQVSRRAKRNWKTNVKRVKILDANGAARHAYVCTSCLRDGKVKRAI